MKYILLYVLFFLSTLSSIAQPTFQTKFGGTGGDQVKQMNVTSDGGCILTGITAGRLMLARLNSIGDTLWTHMMIDTNNYVSRGFSVKQLNDGGFVFLGQIYIGYNQTMYVIRTNSLGNVLWSKAYFSDSDTWAYSISVTSDNGFIVTGTMGYTTTGDLFIVRLNSTGDVMWSNLYEYYALNSSGYSIIQVSDGSFIVAGMTQVGNVYNKDIFLMKVNSAGIKIWSHMYGGAGDDYAQELIQTNDGGFALAASVTDSAGQYNFSLLKTDSLGIPSMTMVYHVLGNDYASSLVETTSGGFIITGQTEVFTSKDILLLGISPSGLPLWEKRIGENFYDDTKSIKRAPGGGYFVSGDFTGSGGGLTDGFLMRINDAGSSGCNEEDLQLPTILSNYSYRDNETVIQPLPLTIMNPQYDFVSGFTKSTLCSNGGVAGNNIQNIKLYPNPNNGMFTLSLNQKIEEGVIEITNLLGEIILQEPVKQELQQQLQIPNAISGIYFLRIRYIEKQYVEKIIVE